MVTQSDVRDFGKVIDGRRIMIPPIQRDYAWDESARQLWEDLVQFYKNGTTSHYYMGNLIAWVDIDEDSDNKIKTDLFHKQHIWQLLDGQQRITSLTILLNAILLELRNYDTQISIEICSEIENKFLFVEEDLVSDDWLASLKPRRADSRDFLKWLIEESSSDESIKKEWIENKEKPKTKVVKVAMSYTQFIKKFIHEYGIDDLINFYITLRDKILFGLTLTTDLSMGFQMFQTANDRGTSLNSYDMFRAFCIKHASVTLGVSESRVDRLVSMLNDVEEYMSQTSESDVVSIMTAWVSGRTGSHANKSRIIKDIEIEVTRTKKYTDLKVLVDDLYHHALSWNHYVGGSAGKRVDSNTEIWRKLGRIELVTTAVHRPLIMESRNCFQQTYNELVSYIVSILQWSYAIDIISKGVPVKGNTSPYQEGLPKLQNYIWNWWQQDNFNQNNSNPLDATLLLQEKNRWISHAKKNNQNGFKQLSSTPLKMEDFEKHIRYLLHIVDEGRAKDDPRLTSHRMNVARIIPKSRREASFGRISFSLLDQIGNYVLIPGAKAQGGHPKSWIEDTLDQQTDLKKRLQMIKRETSDSSINAIDVNMQPGQLKSFLAQRTKLIIEKLENEFQKFDNQTPVVPSPSGYD